MIIYCDDDELRWENCYNYTLQSAADECWPHSIACGSRGCDIYTFTLYVYIGIDQRQGKTNLLSP